VGTLTVSRYTLFNLLKQSIISGFKTQVRTVKTAARMALKSSRARCGLPPCPRANEAHGSIIFMRLFISNFR